MSVRDARTVRTRFWLGLRREFGLSPSQSVESRERESRYDCRKISGAAETTVWTTSVREVTIRVARPGIRIPITLYTTGTTIIIIINRPDRRWRIRAPRPRRNLWRAQRPVRQPKCPRVRRVLKYNKFHSDRTTPRHPPSAGEFYNKHRKKPTVTWVVILNFYRKTCNSFERRPIDWAAARFTIVFYARDVTIVLSGTRKSCPFRLLLLRRQRFRLCILPFSPTPCHTMSFEGFAI